VRLDLDITKTRDGRYEGRLTVVGTRVQYDFAGILELLAILEEQLGPEEASQAGPGNGADPDRITDEGLVVTAKRLASCRLLGRGRSQPPRNRREPPPVQVPLAGGVQAIVNGL